MTDVWACVPVKRIRRRETASVSDVVSLAAGNSGGDDA